jgi:hypothetical protein
LTRERKRQPDNPAKRGTDACRQAGAFFNSLTGDLEKLIFPRLIKNAQMQGARDSEE